MKKIIITAVLMLLAVSAFAQDGRSIYNKYSEAKGVSAVYISPTMFRLMGAIPDMDLPGASEDLDVSRIIRNFGGFYLIEAENSEVLANLKADVLKFVEKGKYELLMEAKDDGDIVKMYTMGDDTTVTGFVMLAIEPDETTFICIDGNMLRSDLEKLIAESVR